jgi:hypothetical protein
VSIVCGGSKSDAAVAHHHGGDAVPRRGREVGIPRRLAVVVGVDVDPAGCDQTTLGIDDACGGADVVAGIGVDNSGDHPVGHRHVGNAAGSTGAVDEKSPTDHEIMHRFTVVAATFAITVKRVP